MLNDRIKLIRTSLGLKQQEFCKSIGYKQGSISMVENGTTPVSKKLIKALIERLGVNKSYIEKGAGKMFTGNPPIIKTENSELEALRRENQLLREMVDLLKQKNL